MTPFGVVFLLAASAALLLLPRRWAPLPLLIGACYITLGQAILVGPFHFPLIRLLLLAGFIRVLVRRERPGGGLCTLDILMFLWAAWGLISAAFHADVSSILVNRLGMVYDTLGLYFLIRCLCHSLEDVQGMVKMTAIVLVPLALEMLSEQFTHRNLFAALGGVSEAPAVRGERVRSQGPFSHAILAGTIGAACIPLMVGIWRGHRWSARVGLGASLLMVLASASSGPVMSTVVAILALVLWRWRHLTRQLRFAAVAGYIFLAIVMKAPAYYLIARIDLTGSSASWHRAALIEAAINHFGDWWLGGTDYTRDWMPYGVPWSEDHADITNHYLALGVRGGLPLMLLFIACLWCGFSYVGQALRLERDDSREDQFLIWALGASLFAHAASCMSIAYGDQSFLFLYSVLAMIVSLRMVARARQNASMPEFACPGIEETNPVLVPEDPSALEVRPSGG